MRLLKLIFLSLLLSGCAAGPKVPKFDYERGNPPTVYSHDPLTNSPSRP